MSNANGRTNVYVTNCTSAIAEDINEMKDMLHQQELSLDEFLDVFSSGDASLEKGLAQQFGYQNIKELENDWCVSFHSSCYRGEPCLYVVHSGIEHIYMTPESYNKTFELGEDRQDMISELSDKLDEYGPLDAAENDGQVIKALADFYREHKTEMDDNNILLSSLCHWSDPHAKACVKVDRTLIIEQEEILDNEMNP